MQERELVTIGKIAGTHGYKGLLKVIPITDFPERFHQLKRVLVDNGKKITELDIISCSPYKQYYIFKFDGITSMEAAQTYSGSWMKIPENEVYPLPEGVYYHFQLLGLDVFDIEQGRLGKITDILETGANDVYVVESEEPGEILLPAIKEVILNIDLEAKTMQVKLMPGLIDANR